MSPQSTAGSFGPVLLICRCVVGALFLLSGWMKLEDPLLFAFALEGFHLGLSTPLIDRLAFIVPALEALCGLLLLLGFWPRTAAFGIILMLGAFIAGIVSLLLRDLDVRCPCFGRLALVCEGPLGTCHILRNVLLALLALLIVRWGGGPHVLRRDGPDVSKPQ